MERNPCRRISVKVLPMCTGKNQTNVACVIMHLLTQTHPLGQTFCGHIWRSTLEKSRGGGNLGNAERNRFLRRSSVGQFTKSRYSLENVNILWQRTVPRTRDTFAGPADSGPQPNCDHCHSLTINCTHSHLHSVLYAIACVVWYCLLYDYEITRYCIQRFYT